MLQRREIAAGNRLEARYQCEVVPARLQLSEDYHQIRRVLAQLGGVLLLYKSASPNTQLGISISIREYSASLKEVVDHLASARLPSVVDPVVDNCRTAAALLLRACALVESGLSASGRNFQSAFEALPLLKRAYSLLASSADDQAGMPMVSYCNCCAGAGLAAQPSFKNFREGI